MGAGRPSLRHRREWFLLGGDLYTAYTFIAVPALLYGAGAVGFFAIPYTIMVYPILYLVFPRLWAVCRRHGYVTSADFVRGRFGNRWLALAIGITGMVATMPYIALQLVGMQVVIGALGFDTARRGRRCAADHRLRHPCRIHLYLRPARAGDDRGRQGHADLHHRTRRDHRDPDRARRVRQDFAAVPRPSCCSPRRPPDRSGSFSAYATLALGSALALFLYPHSITGILGASSGRVIRRNAALLPAYSLLLGLLALFGFMALAAGRGQDARIRRGSSTTATTSRCPALFLRGLPVLVRRPCVRRHRNRRAGARRDHVDRNRQYLHPQHLSGVHHPDLDRRAGKLVSPRSSRWW